MTDHDMQTDSAAQRPHTPLHQETPGSFRNDHDRGETPVLIRLEDADEFEIADGEPDIRGWTVHSLDGRALGKVNGLLVDLDALKVRYVELELEEDLAIDEDHRHAILPIGTVRLDDEEDEVTVDVKAETLRSLPPYTRDRLTREHERALVDSLETSTARTSVTHVDRAGNFYEQPYFDDRSPFAGRRADDAANGDASHFRRTKNERSS